MSAVETLPETQEPSTDGLPVHHHTTATDAEYLRAADLGIPLEALCGVVRPRVANPVALPCRPRCRHLMAGSCAGRGGAS